MISAKIFLKVLAKKDLLPHDAIRKLKRQIEESPSPIPAEAVAKRLVKKGYLTESLAKRLLQAAADAEQKLNDQAAMTIVDSPAPAAHESALGFAPTAEEKEKAAAAAAEASEKWEVELEPPRASVKEPKPKPSASRPKEPKPAPAETTRPKDPKPTAPAAKQPAPVVLRPVGTDDAVYEGEIVTGEVVQADVVTGHPADVIDATTGAVDFDEGAGRRRRKGLSGLFAAIIPHRNRTRKENPWDSTLILVGGGALLLLIFAGAGLIWLLMGKGGDDMIAKADELYRQGAYTKAIDQYDQFLSQYPGHKSVSHAKVQRGLAQLRQAVEMTKVHTQSLAVAKEVLGKIRAETTFGEAKPELKGLLEQIAKGLSDEARQKSDPKLVAQTREAVQLIEDNIVKSQRSKVLMDDIAASLQLTEREIARGDELKKAVAAMDEMIAKGKLERAYAARGALLKLYPDLVANKTLQAAVLRVSEAQRNAVKYVNQAKAADAPQQAAAEQPAVAIARRSHQVDAPGAAGHVVFAMAEGTTYGLDAATGEVLWRRFVAGSEEGSSFGYAPMLLTSAPGADALVADARAQALVLVEAATGRVRWQHTLGEPFCGQPVLDGSNRALVATASGRIVLVHMDSGNSPGFIQIPQKLTSPPAIDPKTGRIYQVADHSNLYVLSPEGKCERIVYTGHAAGTVKAAPVVVSRLLVVAENRGYRSAALRVFSLEPGEDETTLPQVQQTDLEGHVDTAPLISGVRMLAVTDSGRVAAFRVSGTNQQQPLEQVAQLQTSDESNLTRFPLLLGDQFLVADRTLTRYELQASLANFRSVWRAFAGSVFLQPLRAIDRTIYFVRRRADLPGVQVAAISLDKPAPLWETNLASPLLDEPVVAPSGDVELVTALGSLIAVPTAKLKASAVVDQAVAALPSTELRRPVKDVARTPDGAIVLSLGAGSDQLAVFDPRHTPKEFRPIVLRDPVGASPVPMAGGLLVPSRLGQVYLLDPRTGGSLADPFQIMLAAGQAIAWRKPAPVDQDSVILSDGVDRLYRLVVKDQPARHVAAAAEATLGGPIASDVAVLANFVCAVNENGQLMRFALPDLKPENPMPLEGRAAWGPRRAGQNIFLATDGDQLLCLDASGNLTWKIALAHGPLAGPPLPVGSDFLVAAASGVVSRLEGASGKELAKLETGHLLGAGPVLLGNDLLLVGNDGTLYVSPQPAALE